MIAVPPVTAVSKVADALSLTVTAPVELLAIVNANPSNNVVASGNLIVCVVVPITCCHAEEAFVNVVVPAAAVMIVKPK